MKTCSKCKVVLTSENGYVQKEGRRAGEFYSYCQACVREKNAERKLPQAPLPPFGMKVCTKCGLLKAVSDFYFRKDTGKLKNPCKECFSKHRKEKYKEKCYRYPKNTALEQAGNLKRRYGLSLEEWDEMLLNQGAQCAICGLEKWLCVDHCHVTKKVRGLLCKGCNMALGVFGESFKLIRRAASYMEKHSPDS